MARPKTNTLKVSRQLYAVSALVGLVIFALSASFAHAHTITGLEKQLFDFIYGWPDGLRPVFLAITQLGSAWMIIILPLVAWANRQRGLATRLFINGFVTFILVEIIKEMVGRPRPIFLLPGVIQREAFITGLGFPSGHTALATVMAVTLLPYLPKKHRWLAVVWIIVVGVSRVYLGVHGPLDTVGGFGLGVLIASLSCLWKPRHGRRGRA